MRIHSLWTPLLAGLLLAGSHAASAQTPSPAKGAGSAGDGPALVAKIDELMARRWTETMTEPEPLADDSEFQRRVYLDLTGRIPTVEEVRTFLADPTSDK